MPAKGAKFLQYRHVCPDFQHKLMYMKYLSLAGLLLCAAGSYGQTGKNFNDTTKLEPVEVTAIRASEKSPFAKTTLTKATIRQNNVGQDLPFILNQTPSVVINSDAGTGIGYTGIRIRGTDASRINVTLNGIPYNDAESQGTFFVDLPDIASSANSIQIQRGVGTSSNGAGSFGGSINLSTNEVTRERSLELNNTVGSYGSFKNTLLFNSGIFGKHFTVDARLSNIRSDGYIDRAAVSLQSFFVSTAYVSDKNKLRLNVFSGKEKTYQAWDGVNEAALDTNRTYNSAGTEKSGTPYDKETDNYTQTHYQLFFDHSFNQYWKGNIAAFLTRGKGYYEQYKAGEGLSDYGLPAFGSVTETDLIRRLWLDNYFYGSIFSAQYSKKNTQLIIGGGYNEYDGDHYGRIVKTIITGAAPDNYEWYRNDALKKDFSAYTKWTQTLSQHFQTFADVQVRNVNYRINGFKDHPDVNIKEDWTFFNPKAGITYFNKNFKAYASYARAGKEPNRDDFEAAANEQPKPEKLNDIEYGAEYKTDKYFAGINVYHMIYKDQLVLTGKINDVGAYTRTNIDNSYRTGVELQAGVQITKYLSLAGNLTLSTNKVKNFTEYIDDYDNGGQQINVYKKTDIAFSPNTIAGITANIIPVKNTTLTLTGKYVSDQYLDNTSNKGRMLNSFYTQDARAAYTFKGKSLKQLDLFVQVNNIFSKKYEPNGYTFSYISGGALTTENYYFPMAPVNFFAGLNLRF